MVVNKMSFMFIVLAIAIMGTAISPALAGKSSEEIAKDAARIARRDMMIADLKAEYEAKISGKKVESVKTVAETTEAATEKKAEVTEIVEETKTEITEKAEELKAATAEAVEEKKEEVAEIAAETESIATEKISEVKDVTETVESVSGHGTEATEKYKAEITH